MNIPADQFLYFAYGSNMSHARLQAPNRAPSARYLGGARLAGYRLVFDKLGQDGSGKADCLRTGNAGDVVHGALFLIADTDLGALHKVEGRGAGYDDARVEVQTDDHGLVLALTYLASHKDATVKPYGWYLHHVLQGARQCSLPDTYIAEIERIAVAHDDDLARETRELSIYSGLALPRPIS